MKIPKKISILGHDYEVILHDREKVGGITALGTAVIYQNKIFLDIKQHRDQKESSLLHEIIECVNSMLGLDLTEKQIRGLETGLYSTLKNNKIIKT